MRRSGHGWWLLLGTICVGSALWAADDESKPDPWRVDAQLRLRVEGRDNRDFNGAASDDRTQLFQRTRLGLRYQPDQDWDAHVQLQDSRTWDPFGTPATQDELEVHEAWLSYARLAGRRIKLTAGRQALSYGNQRLLGAFEWSNISRRFDALKVSWNVKTASIDAWLAELGDSPSVKGIDGQFAGVYATLPDLWGARTEAYGFWNHTPRMVPDNFVTLGMRRSDTIGRWRYDVEGAFQLGDVYAYAAALEGGYQPGTLDLRLGYAVASGDPTPGAAGGTQHTFQNLFPTNHLHYGYLDYQGWRNLHNVYAKLQAKPHPRVQVTAQLNAFWLNDRRDSWYGAGGGPNLTTGGVPFRDAIGASGTEVGQELDLVVGTKANDWLDCELGYGHFWPGDFVRNVARAAGGTSAGSDFFYVQLLGHY